MIIECDPDVKSVLEFMLKRVPTNKLIGVAQGVNALAPILWERHGSTRLNALSLVSEPISVDDQHTR